MLLIIIVLLVGLDMLIIMIGSAIPESRLQAKLVAHQMLRKNVGSLLCGNLNCMHEDSIT